MGHVFVLVLLIGGAISDAEPMYFSSIVTCNWYADKVVKRFGSGINGMTPNNHKAIAYCKPQYVDKSTITVY